MVTGNVIRIFQGSARTNRYSFLTDVWVSSTGEFTGGVNYPHAGAVTSPKS